MPPYGTPLFDIRDVNFGALPFIDIDRRIRPVEYSPAFRLENAAVRTTTFMMVPAPLTPGAPDSALFQVPSNYTVKTETRHHGQ